VRPRVKCRGPRNVLLTLPVYTFGEQGSDEKRRLLNFMVASASWKDGELSANLRPPFDLIRNGVAAAEAQTAASIEVETSRTDRVLALSNTSERPVSNSNEAFAIDSQGKNGELAPDQGFEP